MTGDPAEPTRGKFEPCEIEVIARKARVMVRLGQVPRGDLEDLQQSLALALWESRDGFDPAKGTRRSFAEGVVRKAGAKIVRSQLAAKCRPRHVSQRASSRAEVIDPPAPP